MLENCPDFMGIPLCIFYHCSDIFGLNCVKPITCKKHVRTLSKKAYECSYKALYSVSNRTIFTPGNW